MGTHAPAVRVSLDAEDGLVGLSLGPKELAEALGVSERTLRRLDDSGQVPNPVRLGRCKRWGVEELRAWMREGAPPRTTWARRWRQIRGAS